MLDPSRSSRAALAMIAALLLGPLHAVAPALGAPPADVQAAQAAKDAAKAADKAQKAAEKAAKDASAAAAQATADEVIAAIQAAIAAAASAPGADSPEGRAALQALTDAMRALAAAPSTKPAKNISAALAAALAQVHTALTALQDVLDPSAGLDVVPPAGPLTFPATKLDGSASYQLRADIGNWSVVTEAAAPRGWAVTVTASEPVAADTGLPVSGSGMRMRVPGQTTGTPAPAVATGDANNFVALNGGGSLIASSGPVDSARTWEMIQSGTDDLWLSMPHDTRSVRYDSTITFTIAPRL
jgi:hypothetical protein